MQATLYFFIAWFFSCYTFFPGLATALSPASTPLGPSQLLQQFIPIDTTNPPGNEIVLAHFIQDYLRRFQIESEIIISAPGRGNLIARIKGKGEKPAFLLLGHLDVVPADPAEWKYPPLQPSLEGDFLYGRGAIDMKGMVAMEISTFIKLKSLENSLLGDVILLLVADEESGGKYGAEYLVKEHWDKIQAGFVFGEGSIGILHQGLHLYPIQVAEKGVAWMKLVATGTSGHGAMPTADNAVVKLVRGLNRLIGVKQPITVTPIVEEFLNRLAPYYGFPRSWALRYFFSWPVRQMFTHFFSNSLEKEKVLSAMVRNTVVPTILEAGNKTNVIPGEASASIDARLLPGETPEGFRQKVIHWLRDPTIRVEWINQNLPNESPFKTHYFEKLETAIRRHDSEAIVLPYISPGATDNRFFREKGVTSYGIIPVLIDYEDLKGLHGKNERVSQNELQRGEKILFDFIWSLQGDPEIPIPTN